MKPSFDYAHVRFRSCGAALRSQPADDWAGPFELPDAVATMFRELGPDNSDVPAYGNSIRFPALKDLWKFQEGYRWDGLTGEQLVDWPDELLVVAAQGGDPIAIDRSTGNVVSALAGSGMWRFELLSDSLVDVVVGIAVLGLILTEAEPDFCDDDSIVLKVHVDHATESLSKLIGSKTAHQMIRWAEWDA